MPLHQCDRHRLLVVGCKDSFAMMKVVDSMGCPGPGHDYPGSDLALLHSTCSCKRSGLSTCPAHLQGA